MAAADLAETWDAEADQAGGEEDAGGEFGGAEADMEACKSPR